VENDDACITPAVVTVKDEKEDGVERRGARAGEGPCLPAWDGRGNPSPSGTPSNNCDSLFVALVLWLASHAVASEARVALSLGMGVGSGSASGAHAPRSAVGYFLNFILSQKRKEKEATRPADGDRLPTCIWESFSWARSFGPLLA
jgi:hypothetical protein